MGSAENFGIFHFRFDVSYLCGGEFIVENDQINFVFDHILLDFFQLSFAYVGFWLWMFKVLNETFF